MEAKIIERRRTEPRVLCSPAGRQRPCGTMIPFVLRGPCPECGASQQRTKVSEPPSSAVVLEENSILIDADSGVVVALQLVDTYPFVDALYSHLNEVRSWQGLSGYSARLSGMNSLHTVFGFTPPVPLRRRWACQASDFNRRHPAATSMLHDVFKVASDLFGHFAPEVWAETMTATSSISENWKLPGTPWTSGIINVTAALPYHRDSNNIKGTWSAMLALKHHIDGGYLHIADYDVYFAVPHGSLSMFDGQSLLHGVTPFRMQTPEAHRYTIVAYSRSAMKKCCADPHDEARRAALAATQADERKAAKVRGA